MCLCTPNIPDRTVKQYREGGRREGGRARERGERERKREGEGEGERERERSNSKK